MVQTYGHVQIQLFPHIGHAQLYGKYWREGKGARTSIIFTHEMGGEGNVQEHFFLKLMMGYSGKCKMVKDDDMVEEIIMLIDDVECYNRK